AGAYYVRDLGSRNGTFVNDLRVDAEKRLAAGDVVAVGGTKMLFQG
ncbi:MAG TPA: FHA domain-containing protein, partial [Planctomycetota bacterium]|nr:FHA domain-containing protein [Planctomycetota bacterium]